MISDKTVTIVTTKLDSSESKKQWLKFLVFSKTLTKNTTKEHATVKTYTNV